MGFATSARAVKTGEDENELLRIHHKHISCGTPLNLVEDLYVCMAHR